MNKLDLDYQNLLKDILENGTKKSDRTGTGTLSVFGRQIRHKMSIGLPLITTKKMAFKTIVIELLWFLKGDTNIKYLIDNNCYIWNGDAYKAFERYYNENIFNHQTGSHSLMNKDEFILNIKTNEEFANKHGNLGQIYGKQWRKWQFTEFETGENGIQAKFGYIDQIANLINDLKTNPDSRRLMVNAWNPSDLDKCVLPPCHYSFQCYTRELTIEEREEHSLKLGYGYPATNGRDEHFNYYNIPKRAISLSWNQRSCDFPLGIPANILSYSLLLIIIAKQVNMVPDEIIGNLGDCHIYLNQINGVKEQLTREPYELPTVELSDKIVNDISEYTVNDIVLQNYKSHPKIFFPLSN
jgi:thymidylate synthase